MKETPQAQAPKTDSEPAVSSQYTPGVVTVEFDDATVARIERQLGAGEELTKAAGLQETLDGVDVTRMERLFPDAGEYEPLHRQYGLHRFYIVRFDSRQPVTKAKAALDELPGVVSVTPSHRIRPRAVFNDPRLSNQWDMINTSYPAADIHVQEVWQQYTTGDPSVIVAVMDEGVNYGHEDLKDNMWTGKDNGGNTIYGYNAMLNNHKISYSGTYATGHGTHVSGTIAAVNNNGKGVCGIAGGNYATGQKGARIMTVPLLSVNKEEYDALDEEWDYIVAGGDEYVVPRAYTWAADHGAVISQNSWGYVADVDENGRVSSSELNEFKSMSLATNMPAMKAAVDYFMKTAGCMPDGETQRADSPMKGGLILFAAGNEGDMGVNYDPFCDYEPMISVGATTRSGTAAYYSQYGSWVQIAAPGGNGGSNDSIWSTLPTNITSSGYGGTNWIGTSMACPHASGVLALIVSYFGGPGFTADDARAILFGGLGNTIGGSKPVGKKLDALASFEWALANGYQGGGGVDPDAPKPPVVTLEKTSLTLKAHESAEVGYTVSDPNGDEVTVRCDAGSAALEHRASAQILRIDGWKAPAGNYTATLTASDGQLTGTASLNYTILPNHAPKANTQLSDLLLSGLDGTRSINVAPMFEDEDGETPAISAESDDPCVDLDLVNGRLSISARSYGLANVTVTATDFVGADAKLKFRVAVVDPDHLVRLTDEVVGSEAELYVGTSLPVLVNLSLFTSTGGLVYKLETAGSAFQPIKLDVKGLAPGRYTAQLEFNGALHRVRFMKY